MADVVPADVSALMPSPATTDQVEAALSVVLSMAKSHCRATWAAGEVPEDVAAVVLAATCRLLANPAQLNHAVVMGGLSVTYSSAWQGWTLSERIVLSRYRITAR